MHVKDVKELKEMLGLLRLAKRVYAEARTARRSVFFFFFFFFFVGEGGNFKQHQLL